ncbi:MAG: NADH:flavin oxidoreductase/NADH oxidase family protein [Rhizobiaceae bacterium]|nr:NADH:flavin oxidoreductase/NADH oxidase family protein [Rhizobiaceae bacterium]
MTSPTDLFEPLTLPCGVVLKNRIAKSAMSDSLGDGAGHPTPEQIRLYQRWAEGGLAVSIIGEVQGDPGFAEKPGNLVLNRSSNLDRFSELAASAGENSQLWLQLGHAGALAYAPTSNAKGPSALDLPGLQCSALTLKDIEQLPADFAQTAILAKQAGFGGIQIHAAHGFLLSQFLSPLFNHRTDTYGGSIENRMRLLLEVIATCRTAVGPNFPIAIKLNSSDMLEGGFERDDALTVVSALDQTSIDLIDISGGTYFPGAKSASDGSGSGPYFLEFAKAARTHTTKPLMLTGGIKTHQQAEAVLASGAADMVGLARAFALEPQLPNLWQKRQGLNPSFPKFDHAPEGGITAWYTLQLTAIGSDQDSREIGDLEAALAEYDGRDAARSEIWLQHFASKT